MNGGLQVVTKFDEALGIAGRLREALDCTRASHVLADEAVVSFVPNVFEPSAEKLIWSHFC